MPGITVGVDGSGHSHQALEWAVEEAVTRRAPLTVITVVPVAISQWTGFPVTSEADQAQLQKVRQQTEDAVEKAVSGQGGNRPPAVTVRVVTGVAAREIVDASRDADLVVVGSRGAGGFTELLLGSVSSQVAHHAACPVVVVPRGR